MNDYFIVIQRSPLPGRQVELLVFPGKVLPPGLPSSAAAFRREQIPGDREFSQNERIQKLTTLDKLEQDVTEMLHASGVAPGIAKVFVTQCRSEIAQRAQSN